MFKIQNFLNKTRCLLTKLHKVNLKYKSSLTPPLTRLFMMLPATCWFGVSLLSTEQLKLKSRNPMTVEKLIFTSKEEDVKHLITMTITAMRDDNLNDARTHLNEGIKISEKNNFNEYLPHLYNLLCALVMREGNASEAEEICVRSIEKLAEIGYGEADNEIIQFQLMLARLYQSNGNTEMAGIGFLNCIRLQETKFKSHSELDDVTKLLYLSLLFWYSIFLTDENELNDAKKYMKEALDISKSTSGIESAQIVVILYNLSELSFILKVRLMIFKFIISQYIFINRNSMIQ